MPEVPVNREVGMNNELAWIVVTGLCIAISVGAAAGMSFRKTRSWIVRFGVCFCVGGVLSAGGYIGVQWLAWKHVDKAQRDLIQVFVDDGAAIDSDDRASRENVVVSVAYPAGHPKEGMGSLVVLNRFHWDNMQACAAGCVFGVITGLVALGFSRA